VRLTLPADLRARLIPYAARVGLSRAEAALRLLVAALDAHDRRVAGGKARAAQPSAQAARLKGAATNRARSRGAAGTQTE
jgi:hypothetical protein